MEHQAVVAVIGSFRQHYEHVLAALDELRRSRVLVSSPAGSEILKPGIDFVRFRTDESRYSDPMIQTITLHRILRADAVYVVAPRGYVGRTTCYEIGRVIQANRPIYFSDQPVDLPIEVPAEHVLDVEGLLALLTSGRTSPMHEAQSLERAALERRLLNGDYAID